MEFVSLPSDKLNKSNPDYDMEDFWYGFKNLIKNYYKDIKDDNNILFSININFISEILNTLQKEQKYEVIYNKIYLYIISFCKALINQYETTTVSNKSYFFSWIKRYNKIPNVKKIEYNESYNKNKLFDNISEEELFYIKLKFIEIFNDNKIDLSLMNIIDTNKNLFLELCLETNSLQMFDYISLKFNIDNFFISKKWPFKGPIKGLKIINNIKVDSVNN